MQISLNALLYTEQLNQVARTHRTDLDSPECFYEAVSTMSRSECDGDPDDNSLETYETYEI